MATPKPLVKQNNSYKTLKEILKNTESLSCELSLENKAYSMQDINKQEFYLLPKKEVEKLLQMAKNLETNKYLFALEQEIYKNMPIDFEDVWCIALKEIKLGKKEPKIIVKNLKKRQKNTDVNRGSSVFCRFV